MAKGEGKGGGKGEGQGEGQGQGHGDGHGEGRPWKHGVCGCFSNCSNCCCGYFCAPCLLCNSANTLGQSGVLYCVAAFIPLVANFAICHLRGVARSKFDIDGGEANDCICAVCCPVCVNCQIANEIHSSPEYLGNTTVQVQVVQQPAQVVIQQPQQQHYPQLPPEKS